MKIPPFDASHHDKSDEMCFVFLQSVDDEDEIDKIGPQQQQLRHDRVVVVGLGDVTVGARLGLGAPLGVWVMRREGLARIARRRDRRLLHVDVLAVDVGRRQYESRARRDRRDYVVLDRAVAAELEHVLARHLRIVGREVTSCLAFVMVALGVLVRLDRQMTAAAARCP